ncbi:MAG: SusC/RagA family TonB-linked outer membrane protein [Flavobacteriaceae bacterium]|nr:SusC/RagA family TonB-linked outer membrane protein [Flavobacteriaceae bacterium]MCY4253547.1 SusC/RagA family TonB-linked outer membrane protein [Flavobacteriaceae bacterium]
MHRRFSRLFGRKITVFLLIHGFLWGGVFSNDIRAQEKTISGTVLDDQEVPLPGATILVQDENRGVSTDFDGNFTIEVSVGDVIVVSYVGFENQTLTVDQRDSYAISLQPSSELEEVVVMGYGTLTRSELTGSAVQVTAEEIGNFPVTSVDQILQGKVPGLYLWGNSGTPGATSNVLIRGRSSINASNAPLYVIDGVPINVRDVGLGGGASSLSTLAGVNATDIESITVLKDATATAQYGSRGSGGVIVINTKKSAQGKIAINVDANYGWSNDAIDGPVMLTAAERRELFFDGIFNTYGERNGFNREGAEQFYLDNTRFFGLTYKNWADQGEYNEDWADLITVDNAPSQNINISARGGSEALNFRASVGYQSNEATVVGSEFESINGTFNVQFKISDKLTFSTNNRFSIIELDGLLEDSAYFSSPRTAKYFMPPTSRAFNEDGSYNINNLNTNLFNPLYLAENDISLNQFFNISSAQRFKWQTPIENLVLESVLSVDHGRTWYRQYNNRVHADAVGDAGTASLSANHFADFTIQNILTYSINFEKHNLKFIGIQEFIDSSFNSVLAEGKGFSTDGIYYLSSTAEPTGVGGIYSDGYNASYKISTNYSFDEKYIANLNYSREADSRFPTDTRWGDFYGFGLAWNLERESFIQNLGYIDRLKLYANYGLTGNAAIGRNTYQASVGYGSSYGGSGGILPAGFGNDDLTWEKLAVTELGLSFQMFGNRFNGDLIYFSARATDILQSVPLSRTTSFNSRNQNVGIIEGNGIEFTLGGDIIKQNDLILTLRGTVSTAQNEVIELAKDESGETIEIIGGSTRIVEGEPLYQYYMRSYAGVDEQTGVKLYWANEEKTETTDIYSQAPRIVSDMTVDPTLQASLFLNVGYKNVSLSAQANYAGGHGEYEPWSLYIRESTRYSTQSFNGINALLDRWQQPGDITDVPKIQHGFESWTTYDRFLYEADFIRLRDVTLTYAFNNELVNKIGFSSAQIYVRGVNLYTWTKDDDLLWDPEFLNLRTPPTKSVVIGVNVNL